MHSHANPLKEKAVNPNACCANGDMGQPHDCAKQPGPPRINPFRAWWLAKTWPIRKLWWALLCHCGFHAWEDASVIGVKGEPLTDKPGLYKRCSRPACRVYRDRPQLKVVPDPQTGAPLWLEVSDDFEVIARVGCPACHGRGASRRMILPSAPEHKVTALIPCNCLRIQPRFIKRESTGKKGRVQ